MNESISIITIHEEIKIIGLSHLKLGLPSTVESLEHMWRSFGEKHRGKIKNIVESSTDYGVNFSLDTDTHEYIAGCAVKEIGALDSEWGSFIIPAGRYVKYSRSKIAELFEDDDELKAWLDANNIIRRGGDLMVEVYPAGAFDDADGKDTEAYLLLHIQEGQA